MSTLRVTSSVATVLPCAEQRKSGIFGRIFELVTALQVGVENNRGEILDKSGYLARRMR